MKYYIQIGKHVQLESGENTYMLIAHAHTTDLDLALEMYEAMRPLTRPGYVLTFAEHDVYPVHGKEKHQMFVDSEDERQAERVHEG